MAPRALRHHQRKNIFIFANQENLRIFLICFFHGKGRNGWRHLAAVRLRLDKLTSQHVEYIFDGP